MSPPSPGQESNIVSTPLEILAELEPELEQAVKLLVSTLLEILAFVGEKACSVSEFTGFNPS